MIASESDVREMAQSDEPEIKKAAQMALDTFGQVDAGLKATLQQVAAYNKTVDPDPAYSDSVTATEGNVLYIKFS